MSCKSLGWKTSPRGTEIQVGLFSSGEIVNTSNSLENFGIVRKVAAVTHGQDMPFFEVSEGVFDSDSKASEFGIASLRVAKWGDLLN